MSWWLWLIVGILVGVLVLFGLLVYLGYHLTTDGAMQRKEWE